MRSFVIVVAVTQVISQSCAADELADEALALLHGAESVRVAIERVALEITWERTSPAGTIRVQGLVEDDGRRRRWETAATDREPASVTLLLGDEIFGFRRSQHADVLKYDLDYAAGVRGDVAFDPRILGLSDLMPASATVAKCLRRDRVQGATIVEKHKDRLASKYLVRVTSDSDVTDFLIEEPGFRVHKKESRWKTGRILIESEFGSNPQHVLPDRIQISRWDGNIVTRGVVNVKFVDSTSEFADARFSLSSFDLPVLTPVVDQKGQRIVGYWNGKSLSDEPTMGIPEDLTATAPTASHKWRMILVFNGLVAVLLISFWVTRRKWSRDPTVRE